MDRQTEHEQELWEHYNRIEAENNHLKKQLKRKNKQISNLKASYTALNKKYKRFTENRKPQYRNNGKGGK